MQVEVGYLRRGLFLALIDLGGYFELRHRRVAATLLPTATWFSYLRDHGGENAGHVSHASFVSIPRCELFYCCTRLDGPDGCWALRPAR